MAYIVMACIVIACIVMACIFMAQTRCPYACPAQDCCRRPPTQRSHEPRLEFYYRHLGIADGISEALIFEYRHANTRATDMPSAMPK